MSDASARAVWAMVREQFRLAERTAAMTAQALVPHAQKAARRRLSKRPMEVGLKQRGNYD